MIKNFMQINQKFHCCCQREGGGRRDTRGEQIVRENTESLKRRFEKLKLVLDSINYLGDSLKKSVSYNQGTGNNIEKTLWLENFQQF